MTKTAGERINSELCDIWRRDIQDKVRGTLFREPSKAFTNSPG
jgi:hypothetical protein